MNQVYPLIFRPILLEKPLWGGSRLASLLHKDAAPNAKIGESWEISDYPGVETSVVNGPLAGTSLRRLVEERTAEIVGDEAILQGGRFPLLVKYIDAKETLSVQVHAGDDYARAHEGSFGKKEAWYIIHVEPDAKLIRGVTPGTTRPTFGKAIEKGELDPCLQTVEPKPGDVMMIPWGMVHSIGAGIVLAVILQTSVVTYRVFDWNRVDENGNSRELHVDKALDVIDYQPPVGDTCERKLLQDGPSKRYEVVRCDKFVIEILELDGALDDAPPENRFAILNVVQGSAVLEARDGETALPFGSSVLIPAALTGYTLRADDATVLRSYVP